MDENENKVVDTQQTDTQPEQAVDNVTVSTSANAQISVKTQQRVWTMCWMM